jgi:hypothetical protein
MRLKYLFRKDNRKHWYKIKIEYKDKHTRRVIFDTMTIIGLVNQPEILHGRGIRKLAVPNIVKYNEAVKPLLCNGWFVISDVFYLGHFEDQPINKISL